MGPRGGVSRSGGGVVSFLIRWWMAEMLVLAG